MLRVEVKWIDSGTMVAGEQWTSTTDVRQRAKVGPVTTVGHLLMMTEDVTVVGLSYDNEYDTWFGVQVIDTRSIESVDILRSRKTYSPEMFDTLREKLL